MSASTDITQLLVAHQKGEEGAFDRLLPLVYQELRRIARRQLYRGSYGHTLSPTGLVHEAYLKLVDQRGQAFQNRQHFYGISARAMRQIIIDFARRRLAEKRGGGLHHTSLDQKDIAIEDQAQGLVDLDQALTRLAEIDERLARVVECRFFAGLTEDEAAETLGVSTRTVQRDWKRARAWLREELRDGTANRRPS